MMAEEERCYTRDLIVVMNQDSNPAYSIERLNIAEVIVIDTEPCNYTGSPQLIPTSHESVAAL